MLSSSGVENHRDPHWILLIWPDGKLVLTTADDIDDSQFAVVSKLVHEWAHSTDNEPLVIGNCLVQMQPVVVREVSVERQVGLRQARAGVHPGTG